MNDVPNSKFIVDLFLLVIHSQIIRVYTNCNKKKIEMCDFKFTIQEPV